MPKIYTHTAILAIALASLLAIAPTMATAANPHFVGGEPTLRLSGNTATLSAFSISGLGNAATVTTTITVAGSCDVTCTNRGGNIAPGQDTFTSTTTTFPPVACDENGRCNVGTQQATLPTPTSADLASQNLCPNRSWTATAVPGSCTATATGTFATITADGFGPITITATG